VKNETIVSAVLWVAALGLIAYCFNGNDNITLAIICVASLGFIDVIITQGLLKKKE
jgi:hypothetical protein